MCNRNDNGSKIVEDNVEMGLEFWEEIFMRTKDPTALSFKPSAQMSALMSSADLLVRGV